MTDATPGQIGDVQQAVDAAEVHERAVVGDVLDDTLDDGAFLEVFQELRALRPWTLRARRRETTTLLRLRSSLMTPALTTTKFWSIAHHFGGDDFAGAFPGGEAFFKGRQRFLEGERAWTVG